MLKSIRKLFKPTGKDSDRPLRVLILGPANAGKTTLLERLTDSPAGTAIVTRNGKRVKEVPRGYDQRGIHNIDDEITYTSNPAFIFHDSGGFEAGGVNEVEAVWKFIQKGSLASPLKQLHAIWLCIPTDNDRPFGFLQSGFFSQSTASVPVIGIFTKLDGRRTKVQIEVLGPDPSPSDFLDRAQEVDQKVAEFVNGLKTQFRNERYPPAGFIGVGNMDEVSERSIGLCDQLLRVTMDTLPHETQRTLLGLTVWKRNRRVHTTFVLGCVLYGGAEGNIAVRTPQPEQDEESELCADKGFRILMELYGHEDLYEYKGSYNNAEEHQDLDAMYRVDEHDYVHRDYVRDYVHLVGGDYHRRVHHYVVQPEDLDNAVKACVPFLKLLHHLTIPSHPNLQYLVFICLVILWIRRGRNADSPDAPEIEHITNLVQALDWVDYGNFHGSYFTANRLARIIDDYTPM